MDRIPGSERPARRVLNERDHTGYCQRYTHPDRRSGTTVIPCGKCGFPEGFEAEVQNFRSALRAERLNFPHEIEGKIETFRSELRAERLNNRKEIEGKNENFRSALRAQGLIPFTFKRPFE